MNLSSRTAAGRSRSADEDAFLRPNVVHTTESAPSASPHAWKRVLQEKIWSPNGPKGLAARSILMLLLWHADANGRVWLGIQAIAKKTGAGSLRTVRNALDALAQDGWLQSSSQTWASLTAEQQAAGRPAPRRGDVGQAPNLYVVLDGSARLANGATVQTPSRNEQGGPSQICRGVPLADLHHDPDPKRSRSRIESAERVSRVDRNTHHFSKVQGDDSRWLDAWNVIVEVHADKTKSVYGLPPLPPDVKRDQQKALAECLEGASLDIRAKLRDRTGIERDVRDVQRELATRVMQLYFKRDNEHLRRVKHALRDLPREFHARITEAMQLVLRESHDATKPRQPQPETKFVETNPSPQPQRPTTSATPDAAQAITAREARRLLETLATPSSREQTSARPSTEQSKVNHDKPNVPDKPTSAIQPTARAGAPRWGAVGPRPVKVRSVTKVALDEDNQDAAS